MKRPTPWLLVGVVLSTAPVWAQRGKDDPEPVIRALVMAMYSNDVASYEKVTLPHPQRSRLTAGGRVNEDALRDLKENPSGLQIRSEREMLFQGKPATIGASGQFPEGTTALYVVAHRSGPTAVPLVRKSDGWKVDVRWWIAMSQIASGPEPAANSPDAVIRSLLMATLRHDRTRAARYLTDGRNIELLFLGGPSFREPSGVLEAGVAEMPLVEIGPGEFYPVPVGPIVEGTTDPARKVLVGLFGPIEMPFVVRKVGSDWRVVAQPYLALMNR